MQAAHRRYALLLIDDYDTVTLDLLGLYAVTLTAIVPLVFPETLARTGSSHLELAYTLLVSVLVAYLSLWIAGLAVDFTASVSSLLDVLAVQWYWLSTLLDIAVLSTLQSGLAWILHLTVSLLSLSGRLVIAGSATDVLHSLAYPTLLLRADACPGRIFALDCSSPFQGGFSGQCSELCGSLHGFMAISLDLSV